MKELQSRRRSKAEENALYSEAYQYGMEHDARHKVVLVGDSTVGKSSIIRCWRGDYFEPGLMSTIGIDFHGRIYDMDGGRLRLDVWDTAGQERYGTITSVHFRDAKGFIFVYDITNAASFNHIRSRWLNTVDEYISEAVPIFIVGNKSDLHEHRLVSTEQGQSFADSQGASTFIETSARKGTGVLELFYTVARTMVNFWGLHAKVCAEREAECYAYGHSPSHTSIHLRAATTSLRRNNCCNNVRRTSLLRR